MGDSWQAALINLGSFPEVTVFAPISYIDRCILLIVQGYGNRLDDFDEHGFHIAVWDENIKELSTRGLVALEGISFVTRRQYEIFKRDVMRREMLDNIESSGRERPDYDPLLNLGFMDQGEFIPFRFPSLEGFDDDDPEEGWYADRNWFRHESGAKVVLTDAGLRHLESFWARALKIPDTARARVSPVIELNMYDTAIREIGALIESHMRKAISSQAYGVALANEFVNYVKATNRHDDWALKVLRKELRTALKFVRNEFAHSVSDLAQPRANALIARMCHVLTQVEQVSLLDFACLS